METQTAAPTTITNNDGDHEKFAHYVEGKHGQKPKNMVTEAYILGVPVTAVCGKTWVPSRDPKMFEICPDCLRILDLRRKI